MTEERKAEPRGLLAGVGWRSVAVAVAAAVTGIVALVALRSPASPAPRYIVGDSPEVTAAAVEDPLRAELARCTTIPADSDDARCRAVWETNRRLFMGKSRSFVPAAEPAAMPIAELAKPSNAMQAEER